MQNQLVGIHRLPSEVLGSIFLTTAFSYSCFERYSGWRLEWNAPTVITSVCSQWRQVATSTRALWSHVDLEEGHRENERRSLRLLDRAQLWLERARGVPIHVHFLTTFSESTPHHVAKAVSILQPHIASVISLTCSHAICPDIANALFLLWGNLAQPALLEILRLHGVIRSERPISWAPRLQGFTNLQLAHFSGVEFPTLDQLVRMISGSPRLHTLRFKYIRPLGAEFGGNGHKYPPITLPNLRLLNIVSSDKLLAPLLPLLSTGPLPLDLRIRKDEDRETDDVVASFLERSKVASLAIDYGYKDEFSGETPPVEWSPGLSHMRMLVISCMWTNGPPAGKLITSTDGKPTARFPNLHTLVLFHCRTGGRARRKIERVVNAYSLRRIIFVESSDRYMRDEYLDDFDEDDEDDDENHDEDALGSDDEDYDYTPGLRDWLKQRINTVIFEREYYWPGSADEEWDPYVEGLMASLDA